MSDTNVLLSKVTVGSAGASSIDFINIPQTGYNDLLICVSARSTLSQIYGGGNMIFNDDNTVGNYTASLRFYGEGSNGVNTGNYGTNQIDGTNYGGDSSTSNTFGNRTIYIPNYTSSNYKTVSIDEVVENNGNVAYTGFLTSSWKSASAINKISLRNNAGVNFKQYSTFYLYGISNVNTTPNKYPKATGGDIITNDGTYWIHTFLSSGTFTPQATLSCDYLVVAGGGGGGGRGNRGGGGGGGGGLRSTVTATGGGGSLESKLSTSANTNYTVIIGAGGTGGYYPTHGASGSNSVFATITSTGGGGGSDGATNGYTGGSGGGGANPNGQTGGTATSGQGYAGGNSYTPDAVGGGGGGGGGAGAVGTVGVIGTGGNGGNGVTTSISGSSVAYGGGGGGSASKADTSSGTGGTGGTGGGTNGNGGAGGADNSISATANTGGGAGATNWGNNPGNGGSGIVIIRYAM